MSRFISDLLEKEKSIIRTTLDRLEEASGENYIDSRLISEIVIKTNRKFKELGLDPDDTTSQELYVALNNLAALHDTFLAKAIGGSDPSDIADILPRITKFTNSVAKTKTIWALKHSVAKRKIKTIPPKLLMKKLGYRSIDSMLKRENTDDLYIGIRIVESPEFIKKFFDAFKTLKPSDFESRKMQVRQLSQKKWSGLSESYVKQSKSNIIELKELGSVGVLPLPVEKLKGATITILPLILHKLNELHTYSSYFKFEQVKSDFGEILSRSLEGIPISNVSMAGLNVGWNVVKEHFGQLSEEGISDIFEPHIQKDDLEEKIVEESLYKLEPALHFWFGSSCLGLPYKNGTVSFNLMDVATNYVNQLSYGQNSTKYLGESLWKELLTRYMDQEPLQEQVIQQLDSQSYESSYDEKSPSEAAFA